MIRTEDLSVYFNKGTRDEVAALKPLSLHIREGEFVIVIGTNGSGKSTLLNLLAGTLSPDSGRIVIDGEEVTRKADYQRAGKIARVFQNPFAGTSPTMTLAENLHLASLRGRVRKPLTGLTRSKTEEYRELLAGLEMNLEDRLRQPVGLLSGGQRQAVTLLMAVMNHPRVLLLDEHTAALDPRSAAQVARMTSDWVARDRLTTLMVTHSMTQALTMGSRILMMHQGSVIENWGPEEKRQMTAGELNARFDEIRRLERLTPERLEELRGMYV